MAVAMLQQREEWNYQARGAVVTYMEDIDQDDKGILKPTLIYPDNSNDNEDNPRESLSNPTYADPTSEPVPPGEKPTKEPTLEPDSDALLEPSAPTSEGYTGQLSPKDILRYH